ncbi:MAG: desulfoferrodoxin [Dehalococcoidia bacterium]|nr:desulfoferrodoxin [Dehalococcoidia bacterium]
MPNKTGKRYICHLCGSEFLVTKGGDGDMACCSSPTLTKP